MLNVLQIARPIKIVLFVLLAFGVATATQVAFAKDRLDPIPAILIVQEANKGQNTIQSNLNLDEALGHDLNAGGKVIPIIWSNEDTVFRSAVSSHQLSLLGNHVSLKQARNAMRKLHCRYLMMLTVKVEKGSLWTQADLFDGDRHIWHDPDKDFENDELGKGTNINHLKLTEAQRKQIEEERKRNRETLDQIKESMNYRVTSVQLGGINSLENAIQSVSNTIVALLNQGPLKGVAVVPVISKEAPAPGATAALVSVPQIPSPPNDLAFETDLKNAKEAGHSDQVLTLLRDGVDAAPFDVLRRQLLINELIKEGLTSQAATEALNASQLMPKNLKIHLLAAQCLLDSGQIKEAIAQAQIAQTVDPHNAQAKLIQGRAAFAQGDIKEASILIQSAADMDSKPIYQSFLAIIQALNGNPAAPATMTAAIAKGSSAPYSELVPSFDPSFTSLSTNLRNLFSYAIMRSQTVDVPTSLKSIQTSSSLISETLQVLKPDAQFEKSNNLRVLAYSLLNQSASELQSYLTSRSDEDLANARIDLGQAIQTYNQAKVQYMSELQTDGTHVQS